MCARAVYTEYRTDCAENESPVSYPAIRPVSHFRSQYQLFLFRHLNEHMTPQTDAKENSLTEYIRHSPFIHSHDVVVLRKTTERAENQQQRQQQQNVNKINPFLFVVASAGSMVCESMSLRIIPKVNGNILVCACVLCAPCSPNMYGFARDFLQLHWFLSRFFFFYLLFHFRFSFHFVCQCLYCVASSIFSQVKWRRLF